MININVVIADRPYRLKVNASEEGMVRHAAKEINKKVKEYQQAFHSKDKQDYLAMIAIQTAVEGIKTGGSPVEGQTVNEQLNELENLLADFLAR